MADHRQEMIHRAAPAMYGGGGGGASSGATAAQGSHGGGADWWSAAVSSSCSAPPPEMAAGFGGGWHVVDGGNTSRSSAAGNTAAAAASSESPGSNSLATGSSITFQEPSGVVDPAAIAAAVPQTVAAAAGWNHHPFLDGSTGFHGYVSSSRSDHAHHHHINTPSLMMSHPPSNNSVLQLQDHHDQNYQFLSNLGFELLSSPTSPYGGGVFRSSLLRSLTEPVAAAAAAKPNSSSPAFQQYHHHQLRPPPAAAAPFWNSSTGFAAAADDDGPSCLGAGAGPSPPASLAAKSTGALEGVGDSSSIITKKGKGDSTPLKKSRTATPSPLPTFKVRKEKLGDRVTALQQLVSPFGKTDTASVLHETIEYIKFLHDQVGALSAPYLKNRQVPHLKSSGDIISKQDGGGGGGGETAAGKRDLTGRGLCLVPISSTFAVASETPVDFWTPFGAAFR